MSQDDSSNTEVARIPLKGLGLRTGMALQTRRLVEGASKKESQYFGAIESKGVMVGPMGPDGDKTELVEGEICVVRGFTGQYEFSFLSKVLQTFEKPFVYALLAYPALVDARLVRQSMRTKVSWPTTVELIQSTEAEKGPPMEVMLVDLSKQGAMIKASTALAPIGETLKLNITASVENAPAELNVLCSICHNNKAGSDQAFYIGVAFKSLTQNDKLLLHYLTQSPQP